MLINFRSPATGSAGLALKTVDLLRQYNTPLAVDFLARILGVTNQKVTEVATDLSQRGAVRLEGEGRAAKVVLSPG